VSVGDGPSFRAFARGLTVCASFPRGATFNIVGPKLSADVNDHVSNTVENGTSAARGTLPRALPEGTIALDHSGIDSR
jgi:hypothetical protein